MIQDVIDSLQDYLKDKICTLRKASFDDANNTSMSESKLSVIDFDKVPNYYSKGKHRLGVPKSNDALYISGDNEWYFIEFKNGSIDKADIYRKLYDSLIMLLELKVIQDFDFTREKVHYILVYNSNKYGNTQESKAREEIYQSWIKKSKKEKVLFGIDQFTGYLLKNSSTYTKEEFHECFVTRFEQEELTQNSV